MENNILSYTSRDFESIRQDLINAIPTLTDIWTSREESDPGMVILTLAAALGDNLSYNMDRQSLEFFGQTVTQRKNAARVFDLVNYKMHWYKSAQLELTIFNNTDSQISLLFNPASENTQRVISDIVSGAPAYFLLYPNETPSNWNENKIMSIPSGSSITLKAVQGDLNAVSFPSTAIDANNRYYLPVSKIDQSHIWLSDDKNYQWYLVDSVNELTETLPRFEFGVDEYNLPYIQFVPYWSTSFGETHTFTLYYLTTRGANGGVTANTLDLIPSLKRINNDTSASFNQGVVIMHDSNVYNSTNLNNIPGKDPQTADEAYEDSRHYIGTYNTLVTLIDFENFMNRLDIISSTRAIDGQYASEVNEELLNSLKNKYRNVEGGADIVLKLYDANKLVFHDYTPQDINNDGEINNIDDIRAGYGFKPYSVQLHMIAGNFQLMDRFNQNQLATETPHVVDLDNNDGYIDYMLSDAVVGTSDDSVVSQSDLNKYKLFTSDVSYGPIRKFPFFINGQIHLNEPLSPAEANLILYNVYTALINKFNAVNLTVGEKITFKDILDTINSADEHIYYFDAGANSPNGSLIEYPVATDFNYADYNPETSDYNAYGININPDYFNTLSLQAYADVVQTNNVLMYFCNTFSNKLTIADDSILNKDNPAVNNTVLDVTLDGPDSNLFEASLEVRTPSIDEIPGEIITDPSKVFRYAVVKSVTLDYVNLENPSRDVIEDTKIDKYNIKYFDMSKISEKNLLNDINYATNGNINNWSKSNEISIYDGTLVDEEVSDLTELEALSTETLNTGYVVRVNEDSDHEDLPAIYILDKTNLENPIWVYAEDLPTVETTTEIKRTTVYKKILLNIIGNYSNIHSGDIPEGTSPSDAIYITTTDQYYRWNTNALSWDLVVPDSEIFKIGSDSIYYYEKDDNFNGFVFAYAIIETITTNESRKVFCIKEIAQTPTP